MVARLEAGALSRRTLPAKDIGDYAREESDLLS